MTKTMFAVLVVSGLMAAPLPQFVSTAVAQTAQPASDTKTAKAKKEPSAGLMAMRERQKKCGAEWKEAKAAGKVAKEMKWPKYWSACNKRLKGA